MITWLVRIWEAGIKSVKYHLKHVTNNVSLTYEVFYTLLTQVEVVLHSRPLTSLFDSPEDCEILTPGHFIIGEALTALPDADFQVVPENRLSRYQQLCKMQRNTSIISSSVTNGVSKKTYPTCLEHWFSVRKMEFHLSNGH